ncbi:MAG: hypothetical protein ACKOOL_03000 [Novosphingobium sp.]
MMRTMSLAAAAVLLAAPAAAQDQPDAAQAESRLRTCLLTGSSAATGASLEAKVIQARAFCGAQINRVRDQRVAAATQGLSGDDARKAADRAIRALNREIAVAVSNFTGLAE